MLKTRSAGPPKTLYLVRHAVTAANLAGRRLGTLDEPLGPDGRRQARDLGRRLRHLRVDALWSSPLARALETARILAPTLGCEVRVEPDLREMALGPWEGLDDEQIAEQYPLEHARWQSDPAGLDMPGHEGLAATQRRVVRALDRVMEEANRVLCVTHLAAIRLAWAHYEGRDLNSYASITPDHCSLMVLERDGDGTAWRRVA